MSAKTRRFLAFLPFLAAPAFAGGPVVTPVPTGQADLDVTKFINAAEVNYVGSFDMDFKNSVGDLETHAFQVSAFLSKPIDLAAGWQVIPQFNYRATLLDADGPVPSILVGSEDLHKISLSLYLLRISDTSPWIYGAWFDPALGTDFQNISGDDFFLNAAAGVGYRFTDRFIAGVGFGGLNLTGDSSFYPGVGFFWQPADDTSVALYGPIFQASHDISPKWRVGFDVRPNGGIWNIDTAIGSMNLDHSNFRAGLTSSHNLAGNLWLSFGAGLTFGGTLNVTTTDGSKIFQNQLDDLESGLYGFVGLDLKSW